MVAGSRVSSATVYPFTPVLPVDADLLATRLQAADICRWAATGGGNRHRAAPVSADGVTVAKPSSGAVHARACRRSRRGRLDHAPAIVTHSVLHWCARRRRRVNGERRPRRPLVAQRIEPRDPSGGICDFMERSIKSCSVRPVFFVSDAPY
jgi:hypothetical protein